MRAKLRDFFSSDVDVDSYAPDDPRNAGVWVRLIVGPDGGLGEESFDVLVCTPLWLRDVVAARGPQIGRHHLVLDPFDLGVAREFLRRRVETLDEADWPRLAEKISRLGHWEFEDYVS